MARKSRLYIEGLPQLLKFTSHSRINLFPETIDVQHYLNYLSEASLRFQISLHAYHLLSNATLLLLSADSKQSLSSFAQYLSQHYTRYFNQKYQETGTLWNGRYQNCLIEQQTYYLFCHQFVDCYDKIIKQPSYHSSSPIARYPAFNRPKLTKHSEYLKLGQQNSAIADKHYHELLNRPLYDEIVENILICLKQNRLLATPQFYQKIASKVDKVLQPKKVGRPTKRDLSPLFHLNCFQLTTLPLLQNYAYEEIRLSVLYPTATDSSDNQPPLEPFSHNGLDRAQKIILADKTLTLREEGTTQLLQILKANHQLSFPCRLWYQGEMFKFATNNPHKLEQYTQIGIEALGYPSIEIELEQLLLQHQLFKANQIDSLLQLRINTIGTEQELLNYRQALTTYYQPIAFLLSPEERYLQLHFPEKLLHASNQLLKHLEEPVPQLMNYLSPQTLKRFESLTLALLKLDIPFLISPSLLPANHYNHTFYEWSSEHLPALQRLVCRGGRYDKVATSYLKSDSAYATGCAFFIEPIIKLMQLSAKTQHCTPKPHHLLIYPLTKDASIAAINLANKLRKNFNHLSIVSDFSYTKLSIKKQAYIKDNYYLLLLVEPDGCPQKMFTLIDNQTNIEKKQLSVDNITHYLRLIFPLI